MTRHLPDPEHMKYSELSIQTQRSAPSEIRTEGFAILYRAGYLSRSAELLGLGQLVIDRLNQGLKAATYTPENLLTHLGLPGAYASGLDEHFAIFKGAAQEILLCPNCGVAARRTLACSRKLPFSQEEPLPIERVETPECSTIAQLALFMQLPQEKTAKALMFTRLDDGKFVFVVVRGDMQMSEDKLKALAGEVRLATPDEIRAVGAVPGYASPLGLHGALVVVDNLVANSPNLVAGANEIGYHLKHTNHPRDYQADLIADLTLASAGEACLECNFALESRDALPVLMSGSLQPENMLLALAEIYHDEKGLVLPFIAAPFDIYLMQVPGKTLDTAATARELDEQFAAAGLTVLFDDRDERAGVKFNDADLIGCPVRVTVGERGLQNGMVEVKMRPESENKQVPLGDVLDLLRANLL